MTSSNIPSYLLTLVAGIQVSLPVSAQSNPLHRYSFSETSGTVVTDSVGSAHGILKGNNATWVDGKLRLPGGSSNTAAYVDLPNGLISGLTDLTFEAWVSVDGVQSWSRILDFGSSSFSEVTGPGGGGEGTDYFFLGAARGTNTNQQRIEIRNDDPGGGGISSADANLTTTLGTEYHHVVTYDSDGGGGQAQMRYYRNGVLVAQTNTPSQLSEINDVNNWLGRSNWTADNNLEGTFNEFRIYDVAFEAADVTNSMSSGPDQLESGAPTIESFEASSNSIFEGASTTLSWNVSNVTGTVDLTIEPTVGDIPGDPLIGSTQVSPLVTTTYTLTATNAEASRSSEVTIIVDPGLPSAFPQSVSTFEGTSTNIVLVGNDPNDGTLTYAIVAPPSHSSLSGTPPNLTFTPNAGFIGNDSFTFQVNDGTYDSNSASVSITIDQAPAAPSDISLASRLIPANATSGTFISNIDASDPNKGDLHAFSLAPGAGDTDNDLFRISANSLLSNDDFSSEVGTPFGIRLRVTDNTGRSLEKAFVLTAISPPDTIVINEIHYDPADASERGEFIELFNPGGHTIDLSGWQFQDGIDFTFPAGSSLVAGGYLVIAQDPPTIAGKYGVTALGPWTGRLSGEGEKVSLRTATGTLADEVSYEVEFPWPIASSGDGNSMELLHPSLDNNLGSSWRASLPPGDLTEVTLLPLASPSWSWRPGSSEASDPISAWRQRDFSEDATWNSNSQSPIGYGNVTGITFNTSVTGMEDNYRCFFVRNTFSIAPGEIPPALQIRTTADDGIIVWINGVEVERRRFIGEPTINDFGSNQGNEGSFDSITIDNAASFLIEGANTIAVQLFNATLGSSDAGFDLEVIRPASVGPPPIPTPGAPNSAFTANAPPNIRQVNHSPKQPENFENVTITAKVTDPQGVASVTLKYQIVAPGQFIPSRTPRTVSQILDNPDGTPPANPDFENPVNWTELAMLDDGTNGDILAGDGVHAAIIPAQIHRTLVRYRIEIADTETASVRVPFNDDSSLNFAYFVYNGVPDYSASASSVHEDGAGHVWTAETIKSVPVYHWLIRPQDMQSLQAYNGNQQFTNNGTAAELAARRAYDWEGAMVYDGVVYDHIRSRLRGGNSRYGDFDGRFPSGKRHYKFKFNRGHYFAAKDEKGQAYEHKWRVFNVSRMFGTKGGNSWGLPEEIGDKLYHTMGVPTQRAHWFHFRVIDDSAEAPDQYHGDFWGIQQAQERYDVRFLESRDLPKGNLYKLSDFFFDADSQRRYQSQDMVSDGSEFDNIRFNLHGGQNATWLNEHVNYKKWYGYSAVGEAIRHYDIFPEPTGRHRLKNLVWYFEPTGPDPTRGVCWELPYDYDASWGPNFNNGWDHARNGLYGHVIVNGQPYLDKPAMKIAHRNVLRSFRDLVWQPDQVGGLLDDRAAFIADMTMADQDRWRSAPLSSGTANDDALAAKVQDMKNFAFNGWSGASGPSVGAGGRGAFLDSIADDPDSGQLPIQPFITYTGTDGHPTDGLQFESNAFSDPQGSGSFAALEWRIGEIEDPNAPEWNSENEFILENDLIWGSGELTTFFNTLNVPAGALKVGHTYRARVRHKDNTGRFSHWSAPLEFMTGEPVILPELQQNLMITEVMYHPPNPTQAEATAGFVESDFEYLELQNISTTLTLNLNDVRFTKGIDFNFSDGTLITLEPGAFVLIVKNLAAFQMRYGNNLPVAGIWDSTQTLSNGGERIKLTHGSGTTIHDFTYDDAPPWPTTPDGGGPSLELANPASAPDHTLASSWRGSLSPSGSPGTESSISPFLQWLSDTGSTDPLAPWNSSSLSNLLAYALGVDLLNPPATADPTAIIVSEGGIEYPAIQYRRRQSATDTTIIVESSTSLESWSDTPIPFAIEDHGDGTETITVRSITPTLDQPGQFLRLKVTLD
ncbi:MAG: lamin tail domain-containing protein [Akkermansiaceae bacterium]|jgi:hypothetical protein